VTRIVTGVQTCALPISRNAEIIGKQGRLTEFPTRTAPSGLPQGSSSVRRTPTPAKKPPVGDWERKALDRLLRDIQEADQPILPGRDF
jgi:hypothetical protein